MRSTHPSSHVPFLPLRFEVGIRTAKMVGELAVPYLESSGIGMGLIISHLRLDLAHEDILGVQKLILVEGIVLNGVSPSVRIHVSLTGC